MFRVEWLNLIHLKYIYTKKLVQGRVVEFDSPNCLLEDTQSVFHSLARDAGLV